MISKSIQPSHALHAFDDGKEAVYLVVSFGYLVVLLLQLLILALHHVEPSVAATLYLRVVALAAGCMYRLRRG